MSWLPEETTFDWFLCGAVNGGGEPLFSFPSQDLPSNSINFHHFFAFTIPGK
jgi:hypothetical protein